MLDETGARTYLTDISPKDKGFDAHKPVSVQTASLYRLLFNEGGIGATPTGRIIHFDRLAARISVCGNWLKFAGGSDDTLRLVDAGFVKARHVQCANGVDPSNGERSFSRCYLR
jgi:hypothetical protein